MHNLLVLLFSFAGGLTFSGIVANLHRLILGKTKADVNWSYYAVMVAAGPSVLFDNATRSFRKKECGRMAYAFALAVAIYWAFMLGMFLLDVVVSL